MLEPLYYPEMKISICEHDLEAVQSFYDQFDYKGVISRDDTILTATEGHRIIGVVRICHEEGILVLRGMEVDPPLQRTGIGSLMLRQLDKVIGKEECWGISLGHLEKFYGQIGFHFVDTENAPLHLRERILNYRTQYKVSNYRIMHRASNPAFS